MRRNLENFAENGKAILDRHRRYDLNVNEIADILDSCGVTCSKDVAFRLLTHVFAIGVETGFRIAKAQK